MGVIQKVILCQFLLTIALIGLIQSESVPQRLRPPPTYAVVAPKLIRPDQVVQMYISIFHLPYSSLTIRASIRRDRQELASRTELFCEASTRVTQLQVPENAQDGSYTLLVEGTAGDRSMDPVFSNETELIFQPKRVSVFIFTDQHFYNAMQTVHFRVIALQPNLVPIPSGSIEIYLKARVYSKAFYAAKIHPPKFEQRVIVPPLVSENEYALGGTVQTYDTVNHSPIRGNATVEIEVVKQGADTKFPRIKKQFYMVNGNFGFSVPLSEIRNATGGQLADCDVYTHARVRELYGQRETSYKGYTRITSGNHFLRFLGGEVRVFKPGQPLNVKVAVFSKSGQKLESARHRLVKIHTLVQKRLGSSQQREHNAVVGADSIVHFTYNTEPDDEFIKVAVAYNDGQSNILKEMTAFRHYTQSGHYLHVTTSTNHPRVDAYIVFTVRTTTFIPELHYQIISKGGILVADKLFMKNLQKTFAVAVSRDMIPEARIVIWGLLNSGEILADTLHFHVAGLTQPNVTVRINTGKDARQSTIEINAFTDPGVLFVLSGELEQLVDLGVRPFFNEYDVEEELYTYDTIGNSSMKHTWHDGRFGRSNVFFSSPSYAIDANTTFVFAGLVMVTDAALTRIDAALTCNVTLGYLPCYDGGCYRISEGCDGQRQCEDGADEMGCPERNPPEHILEESLSKTAPRKAWISDKRSWLWKLFLTKPYGRIDFPVSVPSRPDTWLISGFTLSRVNGLAFNKIPVLVDTSSPVFMSVELPKNAFRGEQLGTQVTVFNKMDETVDVILQLHDSDDYRFIKIEDNGYVSSYNPRTIRGNIQTMVTMDGVTNYYHTPMLIDLVSTGSLRIPYLQVPVPERFIDPGRRRHLYVPGSGEVSLSFVGDVVGAGLYTSYLDTYKIFRRVGGQGEQYLNDVATNLHWLRFLKTINQLSTNLLESVLSGVNRGLQRIFVHRQADGGMSLNMKRVASDACTTAMALEVLSLAIEPEWEHILYVDIEAVQGFGAWLISHQNTSTGAFINNGVPYNMNLRDTLIDEHGRPANISVTALVTVALQKSLDILRGETKTQATLAIALAGDYLSAWLHTLTEPFEICLVTYALHEINHRRSTEAFNIMLAAKRTDNLVYWSKEPIAPNKLEFLNALPYQQPRDMPPPHQSKAIQATSYALLVFMRRNLFKDATPIMKWLQTQRNHIGGFASTADSLVALQALSKYAERETNRDFYKMYINTEASSTSGWQSSFTFNSTNYLSLSTTKLPQAWGSVKTTATGTGIALCQMAAQVNVEYPDQIRQPPQRGFDLDVERLVFSGRNGTFFEMTVCLRWAATHLGDRSGASVLEIDIPTGYFVHKLDLDALAQSSRIRVSRPRFSKQKVVYHFDYLDSVRTCFYIPGERWYPVANSTIQHEIKVYDSYDPAFMNRTLYTTYSLFHFHMCQVCGSFQCPYCPFYNSAHHNDVQVTFILLAFLFLMYIL